MLSRFHHEVRHNRATPDQKAQWLADKGRKYAENALKYRSPWQGKSNVLMVSYDDTMADPVPVVMAIARHLKTTPSEAKVKRIVEACVKRLEPGEAADTSRHVRSPGVSTSKQEIPADLYAEFCEMERAANAVKESADTP